MDNPLHVMLSTLELVYPPVSSQEADWVKSDPEVQALLRQSDFYVIGARAEATFDDLHLDQSYRIVVTISVSDELSDTVTLDALALAQDALGDIPEDISFYQGPKILKFFAGSAEVVEATNMAPFAWFTTEKLIHDRGRGQRGIHGFDRYREFATYELLYVGIAKTTDTYERLFQGAHHARQKILSNEWPRRTGARVTDELYLFAFHVEPFSIRTVDHLEGFGLVTGEEWDAHCKIIVLDAEKAFVRLLDPQYNVEKFASYPRSKDGLYGYGYQRYGFIIQENMTLETTVHSLRGSRHPALGVFEQDVDMVTVTGDRVELWTGPRDN